MAPYLRDQCRLLQQFLAEPISFCYLVKFLLMGSLLYDGVCMKMLRLFAYCLLCMICRTTLLFTYVGPSWLLDMTTNVVEYLVHSQREVCCFGVSLYLLLGAAGAVVHIMSTRRAALVQSQLVPTMGVTLHPDPATLLVSSPPSLSPSQPAT